MSVFDYHIRISNRNKKHYHKEEVYYEKIYIWDIFVLEAALQRRLLLFL